MAAEALPAPTTTVHPAGGWGRWAGTTAAGRAARTAASNMALSSSRGGSVDMVGNLLINAGIQALVTVGVTVATIASGTVSSRVTAISPLRTLAARTRSISFSQAPTTTVATALPTMLVSARPIPMNQSTASTNTRPTTGSEGTAVKVAARMTIADPGMPCAPLDVISETPRMTIRSVNDSGVLVACAMNTAASVR